MKLTEDVDVASPIIQPLPLEEDPEYLSLSTQALQSPLAPLSRPSAGPLQASLRASNIPTFDFTAGLTGDTSPRTDMGMPQHSPGKQSPTTRLAVPEDFVTPLAQRLSDRRFTANRTAQNDSYLASPLRPQTLSQLADEGLVGAVAVFGDPRSPDHADKKRKAREAAFKGVAAATPGGPFSFYNGKSTGRIQLKPGSAPRKRERVAMTFKVPSLRPTPQPVPEQTVDVGADDPTEVCHECGQS